MRAKRETELSADNSQCEVILHFPSTFVPVVGLGTQKELCPRPLPHHPLLFFSFQHTPLSSSPSPLYSHKVILIANVASECGYTDKGYTDLITLDHDYRPRGLIIIAFPCNQVCVFSLSRKATSMNKERVVELKRKRKRKSENLLSCG